MLSWDEIKGKPGIWDLCRDNEPIYSGQYACTMSKDGGELLDTKGQSVLWISDSNNRNYQFRPSERSLRDFAIRPGFVPISGGGSKLLLLKEGK